ncbi:MULTISPECIES: hypothetical protein [Paenibacillus]|uniref:hypothetical protein n=1 Tax=Paenibacillus TaxID=44249 RepID=UPI00292F604F|nr:MULTISPECIES: hypothetical protein [Paenibacillus]
MIGTILLNLICGLVGFAFTFLVSLQNNLLLTSLYRGLFGFILWFLLAFVLRWVLGFIVKDSATPGGFSSSGGDSDSLGGAVDLSTPDEEEELKDLLKPKPAVAGQDSSDFKPLQPPKLVSMKDPEELAKAVRHLKEEE